MNRLRCLAVLGLLAASLLMPRPARAHFLWLVTGEDGKVHVYFSESADPDDPELLKYAQDASLWQISQAGKPQQLALEPGEDSLTAKPKAGKLEESLFVAQHDLGVMKRGDKTFLLQYYAKTGPAADEAAWKINTSKLLALDVVPKRQSGKIQIQVLWNGRPIEGAQFNVARPGKGDLEGTTNPKGLFIFQPGEAGVHSVRVKYVEAKPGKVGEKSYEEIRHYVTLALPVGTGQGETKAIAKSKSPFPDIPEQVTSFGGAIAKGHLYIYGGHTGGAHSYSTEEQGNVLRRLKLDGKSQWETLAQGPHLQGLAMVAHEGNVYRIGGFLAKNAEGEDHDLWSQAAVARFDAKTNRWQEMPALPEPRSSFDAAVLDDAIYVIGGWQLQGEGESQWHKTAWKLDLSQENPQWQPLPHPPFQRRALSVAAHAGKIYAIGGMQKQGGPTTQVNVFDPKTQKWSTAGKLKGEPMAGFGSSAFATGGKLYVSTIEGNLQRLTKEGDRWEIVKETPTARFFHRMLPLEKGRLLMVGGANMGIGKFSELEILDVR